MITLFKRAHKAPERPAQPRPEQAPSPAVADWRARRAPPNPRDDVLSTVAQGWLRALPEDARPVALARTFPRIVNRLALCWPDPALAQRCLDDLIIDRRGNRKGFPPAVMSELIRLRAHHGHASQPGDNPTPAALSMKPIDFTD